MEIHTSDDIIWIKHEVAERHHEVEYNADSKQLHDRAQKYYDGSPWPLNADVL